MNPRIVLLLTLHSLQEEWRKINEEAERMKLVEEAEKEKKRQDEQTQLDALMKQQEEAAIRRMNGVVKRDAAPSSPPPTHRSAASGNATANAPTPRVRKAPPPPPRAGPMRSTQREAVLMSVEERELDKLRALEREQEAALGGGGTAATGLRPGDFFSIDDPSGNLRESSPFTKNMEILRSSVEDDFSQPLRDFQARMHDVAAANTRPSQGHGYEQQPQPRAEGEDELEQSLRADSQFHMVPRDGSARLPFATSTSVRSAGLSDELVDAGGGGGEGLADPRSEPADLMDDFVQKWQVDNGFSTTTGGYAPHRALQTSARAEGKMPNFAALRQMTSNRNFATGTADAMKSMARAGAPPVMHADDALRNSLVGPAGMMSPGGGLNSNSDFIDAEAADVDAIFREEKAGKNLAEQR